MVTNARDKAFSYKESLELNFENIEISLKQLIP